MCKGKEIANETDHLHYAASLREAARLLGYGRRREMALLLAACTASGLDEFGRAHAGFLVQAGSCTPDDAREAQRVVVAYAEKMMAQLRHGIAEEVAALADSPI